MKVISNYFKNLFSTIYNLKFYRNISKEDATKGILFILIFDFLIILVSSTILGAVLLPFLPKAEKYTVKYVENNLPQLIFKNGELRSTIKQPYVFLKIEDFVIIIDTTGKTIDIPQKYNYGLFIGKDKIRFKKDKHEYREYKYGDFKKDFIINKPFTKEIVHKIFYYFKLLYFPAVLLLTPFVLIIFLIVQLLTALYVSILGLLINIFTKINISFEGLYNISLHLQIPITIISIITAMFFIFIPFKITIISVIYLLAILTSFKSENLGNLDI